MTMPAITIPQPWCQFLVIHQPCKRCRGTGWDSNCAAECVRCEREPPPMVKRFITNSKPCPPKIRGQRVAFHAAKRKPEQFSGVGEWSVHSAAYIVGGPQLRRLGAVRDGELVADRYERGLVIDLPLGAVVGSGIVTACYPIVTPATAIRDRLERFVSVLGGALALYIDGEVTDISDQLPYGDYRPDRPDRFAWLIEDAAPTTERCPWCWGEWEGRRSVDDRHGQRIHVWDTCPFCEDRGRCDPIPAVGRQGWWNWEPS